MIRPLCFKCTKEINDFGGILFSPPSSGTTFRYNNSNIVDKFHLCIDCYDLVFNFINQYGNSTDSKQ